MVKKICYFIFFILVAFFANSSILYAKNPKTSSLAKNEVVTFKIGNKRHRFKTSDLHFDQEGDGIVTITAQRESKRKNSVISFVFAKTAIRAAKRYRLLGAKNYVNEQDTVAVAIGTSKKKGKALDFMLMDANSEAVGELVLTEVNKEENYIAGKFGFEANALVGKQKKGKLTQGNKRVNITEGFFKIPVEALGLSFLLDDNDFFSVDQRFFPETLSNESSDTTSFDHDFVEYKLGDKLFKLGPEDISVNFNRGLTIIDFELDRSRELLNSPGEFIYEKSKLRFIFRNLNLEEERIFTVLNVNRFNSFSIFQPPTPIVAIETLQSYASDFEEIFRIEQISQKSAITEGKLVITRYDLSSGIIEGHFDFNTEVDFIHETHSGLRKGPFQRELKIEEGRFALSLR